jgi:hypothetical protein
LFDFRVPLKDGTVSSFSMDDEGDGVHAVINSCGVWVLDVCESTKKSNWDLESSAVLALLVDGVPIADDHLVSRGVQGIQLGSDFASSANGYHANPARHFLAGQLAALLHTVPQEALLSAADGLLAFGWNPPWESSATEFGGQVLHGAG